MVRLVTAILAAVHFVAVLDADASRFRTEEFDYAALEFDKGADEKLSLMQKSKLRLSQPVAVEEWPVPGQPDSRRASLVASVRASTWVNSSSEGLMVVGITSALVVGVFSVAMILFASSKDSGGADAFLTANRAPSQSATPREPEKDGERRGCGLNDRDGGCGTICAVRPRRNSETDPCAQVIQTPVLAPIIDEEEERMMRLMTQTAVSWCIMFAEGFYATQILPYCPAMTEELRGSSKSVGFYSGMLFSAYSVGMLSGSYFWARLSNRIGRKPCLMTSQSVNIAFSLLLATTSNYWVMLGIRFFTGLANCNLPLMRTALREMYEFEGAEDTWAFSTLSVAFGAASVVGPSLGGLLYGADAFPAMGWELPWTPPWLLASAFYVLALVLTSFAMPETAFLNLRLPEGAEPEGTGMDLLKDKSFLLILVLGGGHSYVFTGWEHIYPLFASIPRDQQGEDWNTSQVGVTFLVGSFALMLFSLALYPVIASKVPIVRIWIASWIFPVLALPVFPRVITYMISLGLVSSSLTVSLTNYFVQVLTSMLLGSCFISIQLLLNGYVSKLPNSYAQLALANGMLVSTQAFVRALSPLVNGTLYTFGRKGESSQSVVERALLSRALPFDGLAVVGGVACIICAVWLERRTREMT